MTGVRRSCPFALLVLIALSSPFGAEAQPVRLGLEFQVNTVVQGPQINSAQASDADGDFVVVWQSYHDGSGTGVFGRRFSSAGVAQAVEFQVNSHTATFQFQPAVASDADGDFVVAWTSRDQDGDGDGVFARLFSSSGAQVGEEFQVNSYTGHYQNLASVASDADGDFVVAWSSNLQDGASTGVFARRFSSAGVSQDVEFQVNMNTLQEQSNVSAASESDGDFVLAWDSRGQDGSAADFGVIARRFSSAGAPLEDEFVVNSHTENSQQVPSVAVATGVGFVIAWQSYGPPGQSDVFARPFSSGGTPLASEFQVNLHTVGYQTLPCGRRRRRRRLRRRLAEPPGRVRPGRLRSSFLEYGFSGGHRVPGQ